LHGTAGSVWKDSEGGTRAQKDSNYVGTPCTTAVSVSLLILHVWPFRPHQSAPWQAEFNCWYDLGRR